MPRLARNRPAPACTCSGCRPCVLHGRHAVAEQHPFDRFRVGARTVERDEGSGSAAVAVQVTRQHLATRPVLAANNQSMSGGRGSHLRQHALHRCRVPVAVGIWQLVEPTARFERRGECLFAFDGPYDACAIDRPRKDIGHAGQHRFGREIGSQRIDNREGQRVRAAAAQLAHRLHGRGSARQVDQNRDVGFLRAGNDVGHAIGPVGDQACGGEGPVGLVALTGRASQVHHASHRVHGVTLHGPFHRPHRPGSLSVSRHARCRMTTRVSRPRS